MKIATTTMMFATACMLTGCDQGVSETVQIKQLEEKKAQREASEQRDMSSSMTAYIKGKYELAEIDRKAQEKKVSEVKKDAEKLSMALGKTMNPESEYALGILKVLEDGEVNAIAVKYLSASFQVQGRELRAKLGEYRSDKRRYESALLENDRSYATNVVASHGWQEMTREQRNREIKRIKGEIKDLENKLQSARRQMLGSLQREHDRMEKKMEYEGELAGKRRLLDMLSDPERSRRMEMGTQRARTVNWNDANRTWRNNQFDIDHRMKPKKPVSDIAKEIEVVTIAKLQDALKKETDKRVADCEKIEKKCAKLKEMLLAVPVSNASELKMMKVQIDKL